MHKSDKPQKAVHSADPIYAAMADYREKEKRFNRLWNALDKAERKASEEHGKRPWSLIAWRRYSAIGGPEIDRARDEFMRLPGVDAKQIDREYRDAKNRERAGEKAERDWHRKAALSKQRQELDLARDTMERALMKLARTKPKTPTGAATLLAYLKRDIAIGGHEWQEVAMDTIARALKSMGETTRKAA